MPVPIRRRRDKRLAWLFGERARSEVAEVRVNTQDGRPTLDDGQSDNADRLLERLRAVHDELIEA